MRESETRPLKNLMLVLIPALLIAVYFVCDLGQYLNIIHVRAFQDGLDAYYQRRPLQLILLFTMLNIVLVAFAIPATLILSLLAGAVFGLGIASLIVPLATMMGATLCFLISRRLLRSFFQNNFRKKLKSINDGLHSGGGYYLLTLRLIPLSPFVFINMAMGVTTYPIKKFFLVSLIGILPRTVAYINAGSELSQVHSLQNVFSARLLLSFAVIGLLPILFKTLLPYFQSHKTAHS